MEGFGPSTYGDGFADVYDDWYHDVSDAEATATFVAHLVGDDRRPVLELGVGTGRLARPLLARGHDVIGLDASASMLRRCVLDSEVAAVRADMAAVPIAAASCSAALVGFNTLFNLPSSDLQTRCLADARRVVGDGPVIIETFVPDGGATDGDRVDVVRMEADRVVLRVSRTDSSAGQVFGHHVELRDGAPVRLRPWLVRYQSPSDLDALAEEAGLRLRQRVGGWDGQEFDPDESPTQISVYVRAT